MPERTALIVGAGLMGRWHAYEVRRAGSRVVGVVDPDLERGGRIGSPVFANLTEGLASTDATVVHVCAPSETHTDLTREALAVGRHVLVEKPLAPDLAATRDLVRYASEAGTLLAPVHQFPFQRGIGHLRRWLAENDAPIRHIQFTAHSAGATGRDDEAADRVADEILPHFLSLVSALLPGGVASVDWTGVQRPAAGELRITGAASAASVAAVISMRARPPRASLEVATDLGTGVADLFHGFGFVHRGPIGRAGKVSGPFSYGGRLLGRAALNLAGRARRRQPAYPGLRELIHRFHYAVASGRPSPIPSHELLAVAEAHDRIRLNGPLD